jgi:hypothetical protein
MATVSHSNNSKLEKLGTLANKMQENSDELMQDSSRTRLGPHYEVPNLTSMLYEFTNKEKDRVSQGFRVGNFVGLRDLPNDLAAGQVLNN